MCWRKWKLGLVIAVFCGLLTAGAGLAGTMSWKSFVAVLCTALLTNLGNFLKTHPYEDVADSDAAPRPAMGAKLGLLCLMLGLVWLVSGCTLFRPVPATTFSAKLAGQRFEWSNPKNTSLTNIVMEVATNGTARLSIGSLSSVNDPNVVSNSFLGQALVIHELGVQLNQAVQTGATAAGTALGAAAKAP